MKVYGALLRQYYLCKPSRVHRNDNFREPLRFKLWKNTHTVGQGIQPKKI